jgi:ABC-type nickel/cobalt efflux system permease component RcnA
MKGLISILALAIGLAFTLPAFAGDVATAKTEADCKAAGGVWDAATNACAAKKP